MHINYIFLVEMIKKYSQNKTVLDYGCGTGDVVQECIKINVNIFGVEAFYDGSNIKEIVQQKGLLGENVFELGDNYLIPFEDNFFDMVVCNQVMEHVKDLNHTLNEISRVLKPNGILLTLFPDKFVIREGHCGVPFVHWFPKNNFNYRLIYMSFWRSLGLGYHKKQFSIIDWSNQFLKWLDLYTYYRPLAEIKTSFLDASFVINRIESDYMIFRLCTRFPVANKYFDLLNNGAIKKILSILCRRLLGLVIIASSKKQIIN